MKYVKMQNLFDFTVFGFYDNLINFKINKNN